MAQQLVATATITIPNGQQETTDGVATGRWTRFGVIMPAAFTGSPTNGLTFLVSADDVTYQPGVDSAGNSASQYLYAGAGYGIYAIPDDVGLWPYFKLKATSAQAAARDFVVVALGQE